jgi:hypothetical protein
MAASDETLRLVAELLDRTSGPLKDIQKSLKATADVAKSMHAAGVSQAKEHAKAYKELHDSIAKIKSTALDVVRPGMEALGVTAFSIAGAIAAVASAVKNFGDAGQTLTYLNRQSGVSIGMLRGLAEAGKAFGISAETTNAGMAKFGEFMDANARRAPDALNAWNQMPGAWQRIGRSLIGLNRDAQVNRVLDFIPSVKYEDQRRKLLSIMGLPEDWATKTREELAKMRIAGEEFNRLHPLNLQNAAKTKAAFDAVASSMAGIRDDMGAAFGPEVTHGMESLHRFFDDPGHLDTFKAKMHALAEDMKQEWSDIGAIFRAIKGVLDFDQKLTGGLKNFFTGGSGYKEDPFAALKKGKIPEKNDIREGTKQGLLDGLREWMSGSKEAQAFAGGYMPMAYHPDGGGVGGAAARVRNSFGGGGYKSVPDGGGAIPGDAGAGTAPYAGGAAGGGGGPAGTGGSAFLQEQRARFAEELKDPRTRKQLAALTTLEGNPANVTESLMNRMAMTGGTLRSGMFGGKPRHGFYGPINKGQLPGAMAALERNPKRSAAVNAAIDAVLAGRNVLKGATDQGMVGDPNGKWLGGRVYGLDQVYNDWGGFRGHEYSRQWREAQQREVLAAAQHHGARLADHIRHGRERQTDGGLLKRGMKAVDAGSLNGSASLTIDLNGFPRGIKTAAKADGLFKQVALNRGRPMAQASQTE